MKAMKALVSKLSFTPSVALAAGLLALGLSNYVFILIAGQVLGDAGYAPLGALWVLVFLIGPGFFFPVEQEVARAVSARRELGQGAGPVVKGAIYATSVIAVVLIVVALVLSPIALPRLFDDQWWLFAGLVLTLAGMAMEYVVRGTLAGNRRIAAYGLLMTAEGVGRLVLACVFVVVGVTTAGPYGVLVGLAPFLGVLAVVKGKRKLLDPGPESKRSELTASLSRLIAASLFAQILANAGPLFVTYMADDANQATAGAFTKAVIIARIPLFLFQAVQAVMLPKLTALATSHQHAGFKTTLRVLLAAVATVGSLGVAGTALLGPELLQWFGSDAGLPRRDIVLLAAGSAVYLLAMTVAQALVAVEGQGRTVIGWFVGVASFLVCLAGPGDVVLRTEIAMLIGSSMALIVMWVLLQLRLRAKVRLHTEQLEESPVLIEGTQLS